MRPDANEGGSNLPSALDQVARSTRKPQHQPKRSEPDYSELLKLSDRSSTPPPSRPVAPPDETHSFSLARTSTVSPTFEPKQPTTPPWLSQAMLDDNQQRRDQRVKALDLHPGKPTTPIRKQVERMSQADYDALSPLQRSAVDFNTSLVRAVRHDRKRQDQYKPSPDELQAYDAALIDIFKDNVSGSDATYAPETVALLKQIGYTDENANLEDFLGLNASIHANDLGGLNTLDLSAGSKETASPEIDRANLVHDLASSTQHMEATLAKGTELLQTMTATAKLDRADEIQLFGGTPDAPKVAVGYGNKDIDAYFQQAFDLLANKETDRNQIFTALNTDLLPEEVTKFMAYADTRSRNAAGYGLDLGQTEGTRYRTAAEFRKLLDLPGGDSDGESG